MARTYYMEQDGALYKGDQPYHPTHVWDCDANAWRPHPRAGTFTTRDPPMSKAQFEHYREDISKVLSEDD